MATSPGMRRAAVGPAATLFICLFAGQAAILTLSPILLEVARDFGVTTATAGQLRAVTGAVAGAGALALAVGRVHWSLRSMLLAALAFLAGGSLVSAAAPSFLVLAAAQAVIGVGLALLLSAGVAAAGEWAPPGERSGVLSWALAGQPASWVVGMPVIGLVAAVTWRLAWVVVPFASAALAFVAVVRRPREGARADGPRLAWSRPGIVGWAAGEFLAYSAWAGTLVYAGALFIESHGLSLGATGVFLAVGAAAYIPGTFVFRRWVDVAARPLLIVLAVVTSAGVLVFGAVRPSAWFSLAALAGTAFFAGGRTIAGSACGLDVFPEDKMSVMALRTAALQFGYFLGSAAGGVALATGGYERWGIVLSAFLVAGAVPHAYRMIRLRSDRVAPAL